MSTYGDMEVKIKERIEAAMPGQFLHVAVTVAPMTFEVPPDSFPAALVFLMPTSTKRVMPVAGVMRSWRESMIGVLVVGTSGGLEQGDARNPIYTLVDSLHGALDGFQPLLPVVEARWPMEPRDDYAVEVDTGEFGMLCTWALGTQQSRGQIGP